MDLHIFVKFNVNQIFRCCRPVMTTDLLAVYRVGPFWFKWLPEVWFNSASFWSVLLLYLLLRLLNLTLLQLFPCIMLYTGWFLTFLSRSVNLSIPPALRSWLCHVRSLDVFFSLPNENRRSHGNYPRMWPVPASSQNQCCQGMLCVQIFQSLSKSTKSFCLTFSPKFCIS